MFRSVLIAVCFVLALAVTSQDAQACPRFERSVVVHREAHHTTYHSRRGIAPVRNTANWFAENRPVRRAAVGTARVIGRVALAPARFVAKHRSCH